MNDRATDPRRAAVMILAGMATLGLSDNFLVLITDVGSLWQFHLIRAAMALAMLLAFAVWSGARLRPVRPLAVFGRSVFQAGAMLIYFGCLALLPIGVVVAGLFTAPLFVLLISVAFQRKRVGPFRWAAVLIGFAGALLVIRPDPAAFDPVALLPILAGLLYAIGAVATRAWCEGESTTTLTAGFFALLALCGAVGVMVLPAGGGGAAGFPLRGWMPLTGPLMFWIAVQAVGSLAGIVFIFRGYQLGEASHVAVFEYSLLVFASGWAFALWGQTVPVPGILGMCLIALAGAIIALRAGKEER